MVETRSIISVFSREILSISKFSNDLDSKALVSRFINIRNKFCASSFSFLGTLLDSIRQYPPHP